jgi:hypothetical protein
MTIRFTEPVFGLSLADLIFTRNGSPDLLTGTQTLATTDNITWTIGNLAPLTTAAGTYTLSFAGAGSGVSDRAGNEVANTAFANTVRQNTAPSFSPGGDQTVSGDAGVQTKPGWASNISPGANGETGQSVEFMLATDNDALFAQLPAISSDGTLTFEPAANASGHAVVSVQLKDDGGTADGGSDTSDVYTFDIDLVGAFASQIGSVLHLNFALSPGPITLTKAGANIVAARGSSSLSFADAAIQSIVANGASAGDLLNVNAACAQQPLSVEGSSGELSITVNGSGSVRFDATENLAALTLAGGRASVQKGGNKVLAVNTLAISSGGALDLGDNDMIIRNGTVGAWSGAAYIGLAGLIQTGRTDNGTWDGPGIVTSMPDAAGDSPPLAWPRRAMCLGCSQGRRGCGTETWWMPPP